MKNKNLIIYLLFTFGIITFFLSCEKSDNSLLSNSESTTVEKSAKYPYESYFIEIGQYHNSVLDYVGKNGDVSKLTREQRFILAESYTKSGNKWSDIKVLGDNLWLIIESDSSIVTLLDTKAFSSEALAYIEMLNTCFDNALLSAQHGNPPRPEDFNYSVNEIIGKIYEEEKVIVDTTKGIGNEYALIVADCYLAKATYEYWYNSAVDSKSYWYGYLDLYASSKLPPWIQRAWHGIKVAAVDTWAWVTYGGEEYEDPETGETGYFWYLPRANKIASQASATVE
ncbi:MAG: hypothetical protein RBR97_15340 [Bacteroidales bacterium]|nr:hypothetical protein [Bacteroidales bacterium]